MRILNVGRMARSKGQLDIIEAVGRLKAQGNSNWSLQFVFNDKTAQPDYLAELRDAVDRLALDGAVEFVGPISSREQMASLYVEADVTVLASRHETYCLPLLESLSLGTPVVAYASGAIPEVANGCAMLVEPGNISELTLAIQRAIAAVPSSFGDRVSLLSRERFRSTSLKRLRILDRQTFSRLLLRAVSAPSIATRILDRVSGMSRLYTSG